MHASASSSRLPITGSTRSSWPTTRSSATVDAAVSAAATSPVGPPHLPAVRRGRVRDAGDRAAPPTPPQHVAGGKRRRLAEVGRLPGPRVGRVCPRRRGRGGRMRSLTGRTGWSLPNLGSACQPMPARSERRCGHGSRPAAPPVQARAIPCEVFQPVDGADGSHGKFGIVGGSSFATRSPAMCVTVGGSLIRAAACRDDARRNRTAATRPHGAQARTPGRREVGCLRARRWRAVRLADSSGTVRRRRAAGPPESRFPVALFEEVGEAHRPTGPADLETAAAPACTG